MRYLFIASACIILISGCVSSKIASNKDPNFNQKISRIYLVLKTPKYSNDFKERFQKTFLSELAKKNVLCFYEMPDPLALETAEDQQKRIADANADVVITFTQTETKTSPGRRSLTGSYSSSFTSSVFDVKMFLPNSERPVWRANIDVGVLGDPIQGGFKTAKKLIDQMVKDGLI